MIAPKQETYSLAKAFYHIKNASHHFESITANKEVHPTSRRLFKEYKKKLDWMLANLGTELTPESSDMLRKEVQTYETLSFDAVQDAMVGMTQEQRELLERVAGHILKNDFQLEVI